MEGIFLLHSTALLIGAVFALIALPETRNKSISELEAIFVKKEGIMEPRGERIALVIVLGIIRTCLDEIC